MTIRELIEHLSNHSPQHEIFVSVMEFDAEYHLQKVEGVSITGDGKVCIEAEPQT